MAVKVVLRIFIIGGGRAITEWGQQNNIQAYLVVSKLDMENDDDLG